MKFINMIFRNATVHDIPQMQVIRHSVRENILSDPGLVTDKDCADYLTRRGRGWVCELKNKILGFAIADLRDNNIWALFVHPEYEGQGIGRTLHDRMLDWYFSQTETRVWLGTAPGTRAESFYKKAGWIPTGFHGREIKFEMRYADWLAAKTP